MVDITNVVNGAYETPLLCFGKTRAGHRCKIKTNNSYTCYGIELPVCKYHDRQNAIYKWSRSRNMLHVPDKIKNYLVFYKHCKDLGIDEWLSVIIAAELYNTKLFLGPEQLLKLFQNIIFTDAEGECGVCYDTGPALRTRCGHVFCESCLTNWTHSNITCPMCRKIISQK